MLKFFYFLKDNSQGVPWNILAVTYSIIILGLLNLYSATNANITPGIFYDQIKFILIGTFLLIVIGVVVHFKNIEYGSLAAYIIVCLLLLAVDVFGRNAKGAERWLAIGPIRLQPSEFAKLTTILIMARSFQMMKNYGEFTIRDLWKQILFILVPFLLILMQPDLTTASMILLIASVQILTAKVRAKSIFLVCSFALTFIILAWNFILYDYQKQRVATFLNPMLDPKGSGYHAIQSMIAVGSGEFLGQGLGKGSQAKFNFLPERHTDFAFSVWAEEHGFIGCFLLIFLFTVLITQIFQIAERTKDPFCACVTVGIGAFFIFHFLINIAMVVGIFPVAGVPLTFISYGGTHMITALSCIGILISIERKRHFAASHI